MAIQLNGRFCEVEFGSHCATFLGETGFIHNYFPTEELDY